MVVLLNAHPTGIAVVTSFGYLVLADEAYLLDRFLVVVLEQGFHPSGLTFWLLAEE